MAIEAKVFDTNAKEVGKITLSDKVFGAPYNEPLIHQVVVAYLANQRQGTKATLTRGEVRGRAKKPWRQKHTGRARQGSRRGPQWIKGGMAFALKPRDFTQKVNKTAKRAAFCSALSQKLAQNEIVVVNKIDIKEPKTKQVAKLVEKFKFDKTVLFVVKEASENLQKSAANIPTVDVVNCDLLNTYDIVSTNKIVFVEDAIKSIEEAYAE